MNHELVDGVVLGGGDSALTVDTPGKHSSTVPVTTRYWLVSSIRATILMKYKVLLLEIINMDGTEVEITHRGEFTVFRGKER